MTEAVIEYRMPDAADWVRHQISQPLSVFKSETNRYRSTSLAGTVHESIVGPLMVSADLQLADMPEDWRGLGVKRIEARYQHPRRSTIPCQIGFHSSWTPGDHPVRLILIGDEVEDLLWSATKSNEHGPTCPVCKKNAESREDTGDVTAVSCPRCGQYRISGTTCHLLDQRAEVGCERYRLSAALRIASQHNPSVTVDAHNITDLCESVRPPRTLIEGIDRLIEVANRKAQAPTDWVQFVAEEDFPLLVARSMEEASEYVKKADDLGLIETQVGGFRLDVKGWERLESTTRSRRRSDQAFVAMSFDPSLNDAWEAGIKRALADLSWTPIRVAKIEHNDRIDERILAEIHRSGLLVADFTGQRAGVYFEAGYALGLGIPVIYSCHADDFKKLHFDTRQYNHIEWSTPDDLYQRLTSRIEVTIPRVS